MPKYRKKPVVIEAMKLTRDTANDVYDWLNTCGAKIPGASVGSAGISLEIETLEGIHTASDGDYVIRGVHGEFYPCKPDIFEQTYEPVEDE